MVAAESAANPRVSGVRIWWDLAVAAALAALGCWLTSPSSWWAVAATVLSAVAVIMSGQLRSPARTAVAVFTLAGAVAGLHTSWQVRLVEGQWDRLRARLVDRATTELEATLGEAVGLVEALADRGANAPASRDDAFALLEGGLAGRSPERGVVVFDENGRPWAWAGKIRLRTEPGRNGIRARITPFYVVLEDQEEVGGRIAVGQVLLYADSAIPDRDRTVAARFERATGSSLRFYPPDNVPLDAEVFDYCVDGCPDGSPTSDRLFSVQPVPPAQGTLKLTYLERGGRRVGVAVALSLIVLMAVGSLWLRWTAMLGAAALLIMSPLGSRLGLGAIFSHGIYFLNPLQIFPISVGRLIVIGAVAAILVGVRWRQGGRHRMLWILPAAVTVCLLPRLLAQLASGITPPASGVTVGMWIAWMLGTSLVSTAVLLAAARFLRLAGPARSHPWITWVAILLAAILAVVGLAVWKPEVGFPGWYTYLWLGPLLLAIQPERAPRMITGAALVSGAASALLIWGAVIEGRLVLAERDLRRVSQEADPFTIGYLERFAEDLQANDVPRTSAELYAAWRRSYLSAEGYPALLVTWSPSETEVARLDLAELSLEPELLRILARLAGDGHDPAIEEIANVPGVHYVLSQPYPDGSVVSVAVGPLSRAFPAMRVAQFLRGSSRAPAPYEMQLTDLQPSGPSPAGRHWRREGSILTGDQAFEVPGGTRHVHVRISLGSVSNNVIRGALLAILTLGAVGALWLIGEVLRAQLRSSAWVEVLSTRSYRTRLLVALAGFFFLPTLGFGAWSVGRLAVEVDRAQDIIVRQTLKDAAETAIELAMLGGEASRERLDRIADQLDVDLILYENGELVHASAPVLAELGLVEPYLSPGLYRRLGLEDEVEVTANRSIAGRPTRIGYRSLGGPADQRLVLAAPRLADVRGFGDFYALLLATVLGLAAAVWLATRAVGTLAKPVQALSEAASAVGRGDAVTSFLENTPMEFVPVVNAFERMASDVKAHQEALEEALKFTGAVLANVATGVIALDRRMRVTTANPRAVSLLGTDPDRGKSIAEATAAAWEPVWSWVRSLASHGKEVDAEEFNVGERRIRVQVAVLSTAERGWVVALDDATELATAERVLAWGEMARQVAHEIKNPLTPIRLGMQHLLRAYADPRGNFESTLNQTARQVLAEIERLDAIAKAFSRFGAPAVEAGPLEAVDVEEVARETVSLYGLGGDSGVHLHVAGSHLAELRRDELKEVLINLIENARGAGAANVHINIEAKNGTTQLAIRDDGMGIAAEDLSRIFEPRFSTTTSGTGLGLAICKRLVESWGGSITVQSELGEGTTMILELNST